jgi:hypothetical protein
MEARRIDGTLDAWPTLAAEFERGALFLGNGLSIHVWKQFGYGSLYQRALLNTPGRLTEEDQALFAAFSTENFERVLAALNATIRVAEALNYQTTGIADRYRSIQAALGAAVRGVHIERGDVPNHTLSTINKELRAHRVVFTTSYDLLVYWAMLYEQRPNKLKDLFWSDGPHGRCEFDPANADVRAGCTPVLFLHGALHLIVQSTGITRKLRKNDQTLLAQFGQPVDDDPHAHPLLVSEGSSLDKLHAIENNDYLVHVYDRLQNCMAPLVIFGSSLGEQDHHLLHAINKHQGRPVAVSMRPNADAEVIRSRQGEIAGRLGAERLYFFDSTTHPLGDPSLRKQTRRWIGRRSRLRDANHTVRRYPDRSCRRISRCESARGAAVLSRDSVPRRAHRSDHQGTPGHQRRAPSVRRVGCHCARAASRRCRLKPSGSRATTAVILVAQSAVRRLVRAWRQWSTIHAALTVRGARDRATGRTRRRPRCFSTTMAW